MDLPTLFRTHAHRAKNCAPRFGASIASVAILPLVLAPLLAPAPAHATDYTVHFIYKSGEANAINESGVVAGAGPVGDPVVTQAFVWNGSSLTFLGSIGSSSGYSRAFGINDDGVVCGHAQSTSVFGFEAFVWDSTNGMRRIGDGYHHAYAINNNGIVTGQQSLNFDDEVGLYETPTNAYRYNLNLNTGTVLNHGMTIPPNGDIGWAINDNGDVAGHVEVQGTFPQLQYDSAVRWDSGGTSTTLLTTISSMLGVFPSHAYGINENKDTVGESGSNAVLWPASGGITTLLTGGVAKDINNNDDIVGTGYDHINSTTYGWIRYGGTSTIVSLTNQIPDVDYDNNPNNGRDLVILKANAINDSGQIAAIARLRAVYGSGDYAVRLDPIVEE